MENWIDIETKRDFKMVDPATTSDPDDAIAEELQVYTQSTVVGEVGYLYIEYEIEFSEITYQPHASSIPISTGPGIRVTLADQNAVNAAQDDWCLVDPANVLSLASVPNGSIFRGVFDLQGSAAYTGGSLATGFLSLLASRSAATVLTVGTVAQPLAGGTVLYLVVTGVRILVYTSLEAAINGIGSGQIIMSAISSAAGSYQFDLALIRFGLSTLTQVQ
jgi:hypothetical protein